MLHTLPHAFFFSFFGLRSPTAGLTLRFRYEALLLTPLPFPLSYPPSSLLNMSSTTDAPQVPQTSAAAAYLSNSNPSKTTAATASTATHDASGRQSAAAASAAAELASTKIKLLGALRSFPDFPIPGIQFIDILPLFQDVSIHVALLRALELQVLESGVKPDMIVGLDARGFLFGPSLALRLNAGFVPVRKQGKMPGPCIQAAYEKEYGTDYFQMQEGAIKPGQKVLVVDDIIATGELKTQTPAALFFWPLAIDKVHPSQPQWRDPVLPGGVPPISRCPSPRVSPTHSRLHRSHNITSFFMGVRLTFISSVGGSAAAAGELVKKLGGDLVGYLFILEIPFLKGRDKLGGVSTTTLLETDG